MGCSIYVVMLCFAMHWEEKDIRLGVLPLLCPSFCGVLCLQASKQARIGKRGEGEEQQLEQEETPPVSPFLSTYL